MAVVENRFVCDLSKPVQAQALKGNVFSLDNLGSRLSVLIYENGQPATISGSVTANFILPDGSTVNVNGGLTTEGDGSKAYVDVPQSCLLIPGILKIAIKCTSSSVITTLAAIVANVYMTKTDNVITPSQQIINDWNAEVSAAIATQNAAIANQDTKINDLKSSIGEWLNSITITNARYPHFEIENTSKFYFKLLSSGTGTVSSISVRGYVGSSYTDLYYPASGETEFFVNVIGTYDKIWIQINLTAAVSTTISAIIHSYGNNNNISDHVLWDELKGKAFQFDMVKNPEYVDITLEIGSLSGSTGEEITDADNKYFRTDDFIPLYGKKYLITADSELIYNIVVYDSAGTRIIGKSNITGSQYLTDILGVSTSPQPGMKFKIFGAYQSNRKQINIDNIHLAVWSVQPEYSYNNSFYSTDGVFYAVNVYEVGTLENASFCIYSPTLLKAGKSYNISNVMTGRTFIYDINNNTYLKLGANVSTLETVTYKPTNDQIIYITSQVASKPVVITETNNIITVKTDGTGDFTSVYAAVQSIHDSNINNQYEIHVYEGEYDVITEVFGSGSYSAVEGIVLPPYVHLIGIGERDNIIMKAEFPDTVTLAVSTAFSTINVDGSNRLENITFIAYNCRYACHDDDGNAERSWNFERIVKNCKFWHKGCYTDDGSVWKWCKGYAQGLSSGSHSTFINCEFRTDVSIVGNCAWSSHGKAGMIEPSYIEHIGCKFINTVNDLCATTNGLNDGVDQFVRYTGCEFTRTIGTGHNVEINKEQYSSDGVYFNAYGVGNKNCYPGVGNYASGQENRLHFFANDNS